MSSLLSQGNKTMNLFTETCAVIFLSFSVYMFWAALRVKKAVKRQSHSGRAVHVAMLVASFIAAFARFDSWGFLGFQLLRPSLFSGFLGAGVCAGGVAFCFWARRTLGGNWSGTVTLKRDHELIQRGPYGLARHPMYTGILTGLLGAALTVGQVGNFLGVALLTFAMVRKMGLEESYMVRHFGRRYSEYSKKVKRLVPFVY
jgi:protein-S-isoprenylcysteine O-methyltransferase Ste14